MSSTPARIRLLEDADITLGYVIPRGFEGLTPGERQRLFVETWDDFAELSYHEIAALDRILDEEIKRCQRGLDLAAAIISALKEGHKTDDGTPFADLKGHWQGFEFPIISQYRVVDEKPITRLLLLGGAQETRAQQIEIRERRGREWSAYRFRRDVLTIVKRHKVLVGPSIESGAEHVARLSKSDVATLLGNNPAEYLFTITPDNRQMRWHGQINQLCEVLYTAKSDLPETDYMGRIAEFRPYIITSFTDKQLKNGCKVQRQKGACLAEKDLRAACRAIEALATKH